MRLNILNLTRLLSFLLLFSALSCVHRHGGNFATPVERAQVDSVVKEAVRRGVYDSLYENMENSGNALGQIVTLREWGKSLRNESRFDEALGKHDEGRRLAEEVGDTLEWVQALNNIGTDFRRMGVLDAAQNSHYQAYVLSEAFSDTSFTAKKNRVVSLNGLANVYLTVGNYDRADSVLRMALAGERTLGSDLGQAINYANIGSIFETKGRLDSAWTYYKESMAHNEKAGSALGVALCHTYYGSLYEKSGEYDKALDEYKQSYQIMSDSKDKWHALNSLISLAGVYYSKGDLAESRRYLDRAKAEAESINSIEHLSEIYTLNYKIDKSGGRWKDALASLEKAETLKDSLVNVQKFNDMLNTSVRIERLQKETQLGIAEENLAFEKRMRSRYIWVFAIIVFLLVALIVAINLIMRERIRSYKVLKKLGQVRENFFTNITHEFRTPLTVILGRSSELQNDDLSQKEVRQSGEVIHRQGDRLLNLVNQLLDIAKVKSSIGEAEWKRGNVSAFINMIVESLTDFADEKGVALMFSSYPKEIMTDFVPEYIYKIISNLVSNSIKFTPSGGKVEVSFRREDAKLYISVADTGRGIPKENVKYIFEPFYQAGYDAHAAGTGVGLSLVKQIVDTLGGEISVKSESGEGTTFSIYLPIVDKKAPALDESEIVLPRPQVVAGSQSLIDSDEGADSTRILVVEDNKDVASYIGDQLSGKFAVYYAENGKSGLEKAREIVPDIILTDLMMPEMDGLELTKRIRADMATSHIPVVIITAKTTDKDKISGIKSGADAYLYKPFNSDELKAVVERLLTQVNVLREKFKGSTDEKPQEYKDDKSRQFMDHLDERARTLISEGKDVNVNALADEACMSYTVLYRKMLAVTGLTPVQWIRRVKVDMAKELLASHPEKSLQEVAEMSGFGDYSNFVRSFRKETGGTPSRHAKEKK